MTEKTTAASRLRDCIESSGATYTEFADILGVTRKTLYNWIGGDVLPTKRHRDAVHRLSGGAIRRDSWEPVEGKLLVEVEWGTDDG